MNIDIPINDVAKNYTAEIKIKGYKRFAIRTSIAIILIKISAWIMPVNCDVSIDK